MTANITSTHTELIPLATLQARGLELRGTTARDFGYPEGCDLFDCLWYTLCNLHHYQKQEPAAA